MRTQALLNFCAWIEQTRLSQIIQGHAWVVPTVQTLHILGIAAVLSSVLMINLRLLGVVGRDLTLVSVIGRFAPVIWWTLPLLLLTGAIMISGEPARSLANYAFQLKMLLLVIIIAIMLLLQTKIRRDVTFWEAPALHRGAAKVIALTSLALWIGIVCSGRWIAYT